MRQFYSVFLFVIFLSSCGSNKLPTERFRQNIIYANQVKAGDTIKLVLKNSTPSPLRFNFSSTDFNYNASLEKIGLLYVAGHTDTTLSFSYLVSELPPIKFGVFFGDDRRLVKKNLLALPFPSGKTYQIVQGYNGTFSHNKITSKYAIDFNLRLGDTVSAADDGVVVGVVKDYSKNGSTEEWTDFANFITIYHAHSNLYTQYVHLKQNGSIVKVGDTVKRHQPIGVVGLTGFTSVAHLHFNVLKPIKENWESTSINFEEGYSGTELIKGKLVKKPEFRED
ncbi:MAG: M23 family metallopeptidase [Pedobacter sp.]|nr:MAG: M23 family metallopeptidase [Pedobacter sp.]